MKKRIRIAQIGVRHEHAEGKMATMRTMPEEFEIVGVCAESPADRETFGRRACYEGLRWMSQEEILNYPGLDAVAVETEMTELVPTAMRCAERGLPMHMDKPGGENLEEFDKLLDLCRKNHVILQMAYMFRGNPAIQFCIEAARKGWFGQIFEVYTSMSRGRDSQPFRQWLSTYRGGGIFDFGSHLVDILISMLGAPDRIVSFQQQLDADGLNDNGHAVLLYPKTIATIQTALVYDHGDRLELVESAAIDEVSPLSFIHLESWTASNIPMPRGGPGNMAARRWQVRAMAFRGFRLSKGSCMPSSGRRSKAKP